MLLRSDAFATMRPLLTSLACAALVSACGGDDDTALAGAPATGGGSPGPTGTPTGTAPTGGSPPIATGTGTSTSTTTAPPSPPPPEPVPPPVPTGCVQNTAAGFQSIACDGLTHEVSVPEVCLSRACGLIFDIHGGTMSAEMENNNTGMRELGLQHGYIVVQPSAAGGLWSTADDAKVLAFLEQVATTWHADRKRIHMTGFSQGGYMTWRFTCQHSALFASVAPAAAAGQPVLIPEVGCSFTGAEVPSEPLPILYMHGTQDALVHIENGLGLVQAVVAHYGNAPQEIIAGDPTFGRSRYAGPGRALFEFIQHEYSSDSSLAGVAVHGHCYPGSTDLNGGAPGQLMGFGCKQQTSFHWGAEVIAFFMEHPKP